MSTNTFNQNPSVPKKSRWYLSKPALVGAALLLGVGMGSAGSSGGEPAAGPTVVQTATKNVEVEKVPSVCLKALDEADQIVSIFGETMNIVADMFTAVSNLDVDGMNEGTAKLKVQTSKIENSDYGTLSRQCRRAGR